ATRAHAGVGRAGPPGAPTAILLAEHGLEVIVLDRGSVPRPKICGEYLSPEAGRVLDRLGVLKAVDAAGAAAIHGMRITAPDGTVVTGHYRDGGPWRPYRHHAMGVARETLDGALIERVRALPLELREHARVVDVIVEREVVTGVRFTDRDARVHDLHARLVVGADGRASVIAERL